ncbi:hypothetical protein AVEN_110196-1 [Araneus ventricosus]|uniref:Uncharacterized protein n=1 Tax=Araneus ventricosus TaxID=182803 RepID=A0A4Y2FCW6_ARAVE|nr:hypothetical protein AVEN_110196-1 [Araneus ventricosus]
MVEDDDETPETRSDARNLCNRMLTYDFLTLLGFWKNIITRIDRIQKRLQGPSMNFHSAALDLKALKDYFNNDRECIVNEALKIGEILCEEWNVQFENGQEKKKKIIGENSHDAGLSSKNEIERVMKSTLDRIHMEINERFFRLNEMDLKFGFLLNVEELCYGHKTDVLLGN